MSTPSVGGGAEGGLGGGDGDGGGGDGAGDGGGGGGGGDACAYRGGRRPYASQQWW